MKDSRHGVSTETRTCIWSGCKEEIKLNTSMESSGVGQRLGLVVSGWCPLHTLAYKIYHNMELERFGYVTAKIYRENRKEMDKLRKQAVIQAKQQMMQTKRQLVKSD